MDNIIFSLIFYFKLNLHGIFITITKHAFYTLQNLVVLHVCGTHPFIHFVFLFMSEIELQFSFLLSSSVSVSV